MYRAEIYRVCEVHGPYNRVCWFWEAQMFWEIPGPAHGVIRRHIGYATFNTHQEAIEVMTEVLFKRNEREKSNAN